MPKFKFMLVIEAEGDDEEEALEAASDDVSADDLFPVAQELFQAGRAAQKAYFQKLTGGG